ncbi:MAG: IclR family transcriptional regulator [Mycobacteriales bacterium]
MFTSTDDDAKDRFSRIFGVLELLAPHPAGLTVTEISQQLGLPLSSTHNLLQRLVKVEAVLVTSDLRYSIGGRAVRYGIRIMEGLNLRAVARRHLQDLAQLLGEDVYLAERFGDRIVYTDRVAGHRPIKLDIQLGQSLLLHATSVGKLFAAHHDELREKMMSRDRQRLTPTTLVEVEELEQELQEIRVQGYSVSRQEAVTGIIGVAVPVRDTQDKVVAAIHLSALAAHWEPTTEEAWLLQTTATAASVEKNLGRLGHDEVR